MKTNVVNFPIYNLTNVPEALRKLATEIEAGEVEAVRVVVAMERERGTDYRAFGEEPFNIAHAVGLCHFAANKIMEAE